MLDRVGGFEYKVNGKLHRVNGPALSVTHMNLYRGLWWLSGKRHRYYGPIRPGDTRWWIHDRHMQ
jgi:hypothetical protein